MLYPSHRIVIILTAIAVSCVPWSARPAAYSERWIRHTHPRPEPPQLSHFDQRIGAWDRRAVVGRVLDPLQQFRRHDQHGLLPSTDPTGGGFMIHLTSTPTSGSFSFFNGLQTGLPHTVWWLGLGRC